MKKEVKRGKVERGEEQIDRVLYGKEGSYDVIQMKASNINRSNLLSQMKINVFFKSSKDS